MHKTPCGRTRRGDRLGPSPQLPIRANCLNLNQKKCKFLLCCRCCQALLCLFLPCLLGALCHLAPSRLAASLGVGTSRLQRPSTFYNQLFAPPSSRQIASMGSAARERFTASRRRSCRAESEAGMFPL